ERPQEVRIDEPLAVRDELALLREVGGVTADVLLGDEREHDAQDERTGCDHEHADRGRAFRHVPSRNLCAVKMSRTASLRLNDALDGWLPRVVRDSRLIGRVVRSLYAPLTEDITSFKDRAFYLSRAEYAAFYQSLRSKVDQGETDLTPESLDAVVAAVEGDRVLDVACGRGHLASL